MIKDVPVRPESALRPDLCLYRTSCPARKWSTFSMLSVLLPWSSILLIATYRSYQEVSISCICDSTSTIAATYAEPLNVWFENAHTPLQVGYAFVNFSSVKSLYDFIRARVGKKWNIFSSEKVLQVCPVPCLVVSGTDESDGRSAMQPSSRYLAQHIVLL